MSACGCSAMLMSMAPPHRRSNCGGPQHAGRWLPSSSHTFSPHGRHMFLIKLIMLSQIRSMAAGWLSKVQIDLDLPLLLAAEKRDGFLFFPSMMELDQAGNQFQPSRKATLAACSPARHVDIHILRGVLNIPELAVDEITEQKLFSLVAFDLLAAAAQRWAPIVRERTTTS
ncbi:unnamed protein product [Urochloa humidicola]